MAHANTEKSGGKGNQGKQKATLAQTQARHNASVGKMPPSPPIQLFLTQNPNEVDCLFWIGLARKGETTPRQLLDMPDIRALFDRAVATGVEDHPPLMISDTSLNPPRYFFIMGSPESDAPDRSAWVKNIVDALRSWSPTKAGFVMDPDILALPTTRELLALIVTQVADLPHTRQYYFSLDKHGFNAGLNAMVDLKRQLEAKGIHINVFH